VIKRRTIKKLTQERDHLTNIMARHDFRKRGKLNAVVIDDDFSVLRLMKSYLKDYGFQTVSVYEDEYNGLKSIAENLPDIVILDLRLKITNGINIAKVLSSMIGIEVPVLLISEQNKNEKELIEVVNSTRVRFLKKPFNKTLLEEKLFNLLERKELKKTG